ncbi:DUF5995 family protein [Halobacillus litoralis]|uniref:DUF5995 family protein n=1 Tax=Halobacillus litoralis TaxID=45668 RepID=UPI001CFE5C7D|nr:DUF5995 family protein [Halobacillus litoralis]
MKSISKPVSQLETLEDVIEQMRNRLKNLDETKDYRCVFHRVYLLMTKQMQHRLESGFFIDSIWMERVLVRFAHYYFYAMEAYEKSWTCPRAWTLAFQMAEEKQTFVLQDALLGINAHINRDLPVVLHEILQEDEIWPDARLMLNRRRDHERINDVLADLIDIVQEELIEHHARLLKWIDRFMQRSDETLSSFFLTYCRTNVWYNTELLLNAGHPEEFLIEKNRIDEEAYAIGLDIASFPSRFRFIRKAAPLTRKYRLF